MSEFISERTVANVRLLTLELSEDELAVFVACLEYTLAHGDDKTLERFVGAPRDEVEAMRDDLASILKTDSRF